MNTLRENLSEYLPIIAFWAVAFTLSLLACVDSGDGDAPGDAGDVDASGENTDIGEPLCFENRDTLGSAGAMGMISTVTDRGIGLQIGLGDRLDADISVHNATGEARSVHVGGHTGGCFVDAEGQIGCRHGDFFEQLDESFQDIAVLHRASALDAEDDEAKLCGITADGSVSCVRSDPEGQVEESDEQIHPPNPDEPRASIFAPGNWGSSTTRAFCGIYADDAEEQLRGTVDCWGPDYSDPSPGEIEQMIPDKRFDHIAFVSSDAMTKRGCGILEDSRLTCWNHPNLEDGLLPGHEEFADVSVGENAVCAVTVEGKLLCEEYRYQQDVPGSVSRHQFDVSDSDGGDYEHFGEALADEKADEIVSLEATRPTGDNFVAVAVMKRQACAMRSDGTIECWGAELETRGWAEYMPEWEHDPEMTVEQFRDEYGEESTVKTGPVNLNAAMPEQLASELRGPFGPYRGESCEPVDEPLDTDLEDGSTRRVAVSAGNEHSCQLTRDGDVECWGNNDRGQADGPPEDEYRDIGSGHTVSCAVQDSFVSRQPECWGEFTGDPSVFPPTPPPGNYEQLDMGAAFACGVDVDGYIECWGHSSPGLSGEPPEAPDYTQVAVGLHFACAVAEYPFEGTGFQRAWRGPYEYEIHCWGGLSEDGPDEHEAELNPDSTSRWNEVRDLDVQAHETGSTACVIAGDGQLSCHYTTFHDELDDDRDEPEPPESADEPFEQVAIGDNHICALDTRGTIHCSGDNDEGQLDAPDGQFRQIAAGHSHNCALEATEEATVHCWGDDEHGQSSP